MCILLSALNFFSQARIKALEMKFDFDTLYQYDTVEHDFKFVNVGNENLKISNAHTICGCDVVFCNKYSIAPADTLIIHYKYDSKRVGKFRKGFSFKTNDLDNQVINIRTKGVVILPNK